MLRGLVRRPAVRGAAVVGLDGRQAGRRLATDDVFGPDRREIQWEGEYREVVEPERLSFTISDQPGDAYELVTVVLTDLGDGRTEMRMQQRGGLRRRSTSAAQGWSGSSTASPSDLALGG